MQYVYKAATGKRRRLRPLAWASAALMVTGFSAAFATAASAAPGPSPAPAAHVAPAAVATSAGSRFVFYSAANGTVWKKLVGSSTPAVQASNGRLLTGPSVIWAGGRTLFVFGQGFDGGLWNATCTATDTGGCSGWRNMGGRITSKPGAANVNGTYYSVYARGTGGAVWGRRHTGAGWGPWFTTGGAVRFGTGPAAVGRGTSYWVLVTGTNRSLWIQNVTGTGFGAFGNAGGVTDAGPGLANVPAQLVGYARGTTGAGYYHLFRAGTGGWHSLGGELSSGMAGASWSGAAYGYALGLNGQVYENAALRMNWIAVTP